MSELSLAVRPGDGQGALDRRMPLELCEDAFDFLRTHTAPLARIAAVVVLPVQLLIAYLDRAAYSGNSVAVVLHGGSLSHSSALPSDGIATGIVSVAGILGFFSLAIVSGPVARLVAAWRTGREISLREATRLSLSTWLSVLVACLMVHVFELVGMLALGVGSYFAMTVFAVVTPVAVLEQAGPFRSVGRAWTLSLRRFGPVLGAVSAMTFVTVLFSYALGRVLAIIPQFVGFHGGWELAAAGQVLAEMAAYSVSATFVALLYIDLRVWTEGMDLALALARGRR